MYIAIFNNINHGITGKLCKWATGYADYHVGITDLSSFWDQDLLFRKRQWMPRPEEEVTLYKCPVDITAGELDQIVIAGVEQLCINKSLDNIYGYLDYLRFGLNKFGFKLKHKLPGIVCSGRVRDILASKGWLELGEIDSLEPTPADIRRKLRSLNILCLKEGNVS